MIGSVRAAIAACVGLFVLTAAGEPPALAQTSASAAPQPTAPVYLVLGDRAEPTFSAADAALANANPDDPDAAPAIATPSSDISGEDEHCLAVAVYYESRGEPLAGQAAVAQVILNRVASGRFAPSVCGVIRQPGQFSFSHSTTPPANGDWREAQAVAHAAIAGKVDRAMTAALYFHASYVAPGWGRARVATIGHHIFYR